MTKKILKKCRASLAKNNSARAFSLIELSIVILIVSFLAVAALSLFSGSVTNTKVQITNNRIQSVYRALQNYVAANGFLPCPAKLNNLKSTSNDYGVQIPSCSSKTTSSGSEFYVNSNVIYGMVPIRALNLNNDMAEDGFGNKLVYIVDKRFTYSLGSKPFVDLSGTINVQKFNPSSATEEANAIFAIISHGANQKGAFPANSSAQIPITAADTNEVNNNPANPTSSIISFSSNSVFDDVIFYKNKANLLLDSNATFLQSSNLN